MSNTRTIYREHTADAAYSDSPGPQGGPAPEGPDDIGTLPLGIDDFESPGEPQPYAFLIQLPRNASSTSDAPFGQVTVHLRAFDGAGIVVPQAIVQSEDWDSNWTWEVRETDNEIRQACMGRWYGQAACDGGLEAFSVTNAEGQRFDQQLPAGKQSLFGEFMMQGFRVETIKSIALNWAATDPGPLGLPDFDDFDLVGTGQDRLRLEVGCPDNSFNFVKTYYPQIRLHVSIEDV